MTARTPDHAAILAAASLLAIPPLPRAVPAPPAIASSAASISTISSMSDAASSTRGSAVNTPEVSVSSTSSVGAHEVGHEGGEAVVVAVADLVVGHGVVLVDHRDDPEVHQPANVSRAWRYWARWPKSNGVSSTCPATSPCAANIAPNRSISRGCPTAATAWSVPMSVGRLDQAERGHPRRDRAGCDEHHLVSGRAGRRDLARRA